MYRQREPAWAASIPTRQRPEACLPDQLPEARRAPGHFRTKYDADIRLGEVEISKNRSTFVDPADARILIVDLGEDWVASRRADLKPSTFRTVESAWRIHVRPKWGSRAVGGIRYSEIQMWIAELSSTHSATSVRPAHEVLAGIHEIATRDRRTSANPARGLKLPRKAAKPRAYPTHEQVAELAAEATRPELIVFLAYTGLRWGEATGLRIKHIDLKRRRVSVEENAAEVGSFIEIGTPKTHENRQVPYPAFLAETMQALVAGKGRDALVSGEGLIHVRRPKATTGWFNSAVCRAQKKSAAAIEAAVDAGEEPPRPFPRVTTHDLRHTAASLAISAGANVKAGSGCWATHQLR
jgi:integrase